MSDQCVGEIRLFAGVLERLPAGWALCDGTLLPVAQNQVLFAVIGNTWGGDGISNFALPDLRGRLPIGQGQAPNLSMRALGQMSGAETVTLTTAQLPSHTHPLMADPTGATLTNPAGALLAQAVNSGGGKDVRYLPGSPVPTHFQTLSGSAIVTAGSGQAHANIMPCFGINFIIALQGAYP